MHKCAKCHHEAVFVDWVRIAVGYQWQFLCDLHAQGYDVDRLVHLDLLPWQLSSRLPQPIYESVYYQEPK